MVYDRLLTYFYAMLLVFSQQQVLLHPYQHKADWQQETYQLLTVGTIVPVQSTVLSDDEISLISLVAEDSYDNKQAPGHGVSCAKCIALSGINSVISAHSFVFQILPNHTQHTILAVQSFVAAVNVQYQSRAPPAFA